MLDIYICEDEEAQRKSVTDIIEKEICIQDYDMQVKLSSGSPQEIINTVKESKNAGIYFFDIEIEKDFNGIKLAEEVRKYDSRGFIIFITGHLEFLYYCVDAAVEPLGYILKEGIDQIAAKVRTCLAKALKRYEIKTEINKTVSIKSKGRVINVEAGNIIYIETTPVPHKLRLHTPDSICEFYGTIKQLEKDLADYEFLIKINSSYIINKDCIEEIDKSNYIIYLKNNEEIMASKSAIKKIK